MHPLLLACVCVGGGGVKEFQEKPLLGVSEIFILVLVRGGLGGYILLGGSHNNFDVKIKTAQYQYISIKSIFGITNLVYFRDI